MGERRRVLIVAYFFPPLGGAGVQRSLKLAKYLPELGWEPTILTVGSRDYWMADETLADELGPRARILRTRSLTGLSLLRRLAPTQAGAADRPRQESGRLGLLRRAASWICVPDSYIGWVPFANYAGRRLLSRQPFDLIYTTSSPDSAHLIGRSLARRFGLPWVSDFRDPWTRRISYRPPTPLHHRWHRRLERRVLEEASLITVTAEATRRDYLQLYPELAPEKITVVTNGYDEADFARPRSAGLPRDHLSILHAGQLNPQRPAKPLLEGLALFLQQRPEARGKVRVRFVGPSYQHDHDDAARLGLSEAVGFERARPHREVVAELCRSHLLLLMEEDSPRGGLILPGKVFEYLRSGRPILGLLPRGAAWDLVEQHRAGTCCRTEDRAAVAAALAGYFGAFERGGVPPTGLTADELAPYERRALAQQMAGHFDRLAERKNGDELHIVCN